MCFLPPVEPSVYFVLPVWFEVCILKPGHCRSLLFRSLPLFMYRGHGPTCRWRFSLSTMCVLASNLGPHAWWQAPLPNEPSHSACPRTLPSVWEAKPEMAGILTFSQPEHFRHFPVQWPLRRPTNTKIQKGFGKLQRGCQSSQGEHVPLALFG